MTLGQDLNAALPELRAQAESRMTDTWRITRGGSAPQFDHETGTYVTGGSTIYEGPGRLKLSSGVVSDRDAQGQLLAVQGPSLHLPVSTSGAVRPGDTAVLLASPNDPAAVGLVVTVEGRFVQTDATARRFPVEVHS